jgi:hypothetical protein
MAEATPNTRRSMGTSAHLPAHPELQLRRCRVEVPPEVGRDDGELEMAGSEPAVRLGRSA